MKSFISAVMCVYVSPFGHVGMAVSIVKLDQKYSKNNSLLRKHINIKKHFIQLLFYT